MEYGWKEDSELVLKLKKRKMEKTSQSFRSRAIKQKKHRMMGETEQISSGSSSFDRRKDFQKRYGWKGNNKISISETSSDVFSCGTISPEITNSVNASTEQTMSNIANTMVDTSTSATAPPVAVAKKIYEVAKESAVRTKDFFVGNLQRHSRLDREDAENKKSGDKTSDTAMMVVFPFVGAVALILLCIMMIIAPFIMAITAAPMMGASVIPSVIESMMQTDTSIVDAAKRELEVSAENIGGQKYKDWYGIDGNWCAMFVSYCANECGYIEKEVMPKSASVLAMSVWYKQKEQWQDAENYIPKAGDIIFFQNGASHVGIVIDYDADKKIIYTIEGNTGSSNTEPYHLGSCVKQCRYSLKYAKISGYGLPNYSEVLVTPSVKETEESLKDKMEMERIITYENTN